VRHVILLLAAVAALAAVPTAPARAAGGLTGIDIMTATVFQEGQSSFSGLGLRFRINDPRLADNIEILPTFEYWRNSSTVSAYDLHSVRRDGTLGGDIRYVFPGETWRFYAGTGVAVHFLSDQVDAPTIGVVGDDSKTKGGLTMLAGLWFGSRSKVGNFLEVKGHLVGGYRQLKINMGLTWNR
jgi:hypothetical protein